MPFRKNCEYVRHSDSGSSQHGGRPRICLALVTLTLPRTDNLVALSLTLFVLTTESHQISLLELVPQACRKTFWKNQVLLTIGWSLRILAVSRKFSHQGHVQAHLSYPDFVILAFTFSISWFTLQDSAQGQWKF